jgi:hypothetical protein
MKRHRWTLALSSMLVLQFLTAGASSYAAESILSDQHFMMCGGSHFLHSEAYRNVLEAYGLTVVEAPHERTIVFDDRQAWGAVWK